MSTWTNTTSRLAPGSIYRANRAAGIPARYALQRARTITALLDTLEGMTLENVYSERVESIFTLEDVNAGVTVTYEICRDYDGTPEDAECYDPEDITAWRRDDWHYYGFTVTATLGRFSVEESLWGIEAGGYWESPASPLDTEEQVMMSALDYYPVRDMITAVQDAAIAACLQAPNTNTEG